MRDKQIITALREMTKFFDKPIYIVGGAIRNYILNFDIDDIDLTGAVLPEEVIEKLKDSRYKVSLTSPKMYTLKIEDKDRFYEFTSFRKDTYTGGKHKPDKASFTMDIIEDAKRRDFTVNAIYYDIAKDKFLDPLGGMKDLKESIIKTVNDSQKVFSQDGLRLMRLARLAAETGMEITKEVMASARKYSYLIKDIAMERIREEFDRIIRADSKYNIPLAHVKGLRLMEEIGVLNYILPELEKAKGVEQRKDFHKYDVYTHIVKCFEYSRSDIRLAALLHDIAKPYCIHEDGSMKGHDRKGKEMTQAILSRMKYSKKTINQTKRLVNLHMYDLSVKAKDSTIRKFIQDNFDILDKLIALKLADHKAGGVVSGDSPSAIRLKKVYEEMKKQGIPFTVKDLKVNGKDLIELDIPERKRTLALNSLLKASIYGKEMLTRKGQLNYIKQIKITFKHSKNL